jgi:hypothetical protein
LRRGAARPRLAFPALVALYRFHTRGEGRVLALAARPTSLPRSSRSSACLSSTLPGLFGISVSILLLLYYASRP